MTNFANVFQSKLQASWVHKVLVFLRMQLQANVRRMAHAGQFSWRVISSSWRRHEQVSKAINNSVLAFGGFTAALWTIAAVLWLLFWVLAIVMVMFSFDFLMGVVQALYLAAYLTFQVAYVFVIITVVVFALAVLFRGVSMWIQDS